MVFTPTLNNDIRNFLSTLGIESYISENVLAVNRTSMVCAHICKSLDEDNSYKIVLELIKEKFLTPCYYITWSGKTDDDYFLDVYTK